VYAYIEGTLSENTDSEVVLDVSGVGYQVFIPANASRNLPHIGLKVKLHTSLVIRENSHTIYGFLSKQEKDLFEAVQNVSGIGPKTALNVVGHLSPFEFQKAVSKGDITSLSRVPGIGKKTAERLIIEMRDKLPKSEVYKDKDTVPVPLRDALRALVNLGYTQNKAQNAIEKAIQESSIELDLASLITHSLKHL